MEIKQRKMQEGVVKKNILFITFDQWRGDTLGVAGHPHVKTPNVDRFAKEAVYFSQHFCQAAPCGPARASLYTGLYQMNTRVVRNGTPLDARHDTIALATRRVGYDPTLFGGTDQAIDPRTTTGDDPWLKTYEGILPGMNVRVRLPQHLAPWFSWLAEQGVDLPENAHDIWLPVDGPADPPDGKPALYTAEQTETKFLTDEFLRWLSERSGQNAPMAETENGADKPWFAHLSFIRPHPPYVAPEPYASMYSPDQVEGFLGEKTPEDQAAVHPFLAYALKALDKSSLIYGASGPVTDWEEATKKQITATYWGMVSEVDAQFGRLIEGLKAVGIYDSTLIVLTSDHADMMGDHQLFSKMGYYDQAYHVPLLIRDPDYPQSHGSRVDEFSESIDIMPTILECVGAEVPQYLDGLSLLPFLKGQVPVDWREETHWEYDFREVATKAAQDEFNLPLDACSMAVIRSKSFKYVHFAGLPPLLFDLDNDPGETSNVVDLPAYQQIRLDMAEKLLSWRACHLDKCLTGIVLTPKGPVNARST